MSARELEFVKMQAAGNDFVMIDNRNGTIAHDELADLARRFCHRKFGIGADGLMLLEETGEGAVMVYKNPDGSDAGMCGNGARCFVLFAQQLGYPHEFSFQVNSKRYHTHTTDGEIAVDFPLSTRVEPIRVDDADLLKIYTNTEHVVLPTTVEELERRQELVRQGRKFRKHPDLDPPGTNVNFIAGDRPGTVHVQTYERGVEDLTLACGTGAIAAAIGWHHLNRSGGGRHSISVRTRGGRLGVTFRFREKEKSYSEITLYGPVETVFHGRIKR